MHVALYNAFKWTPPQFGHVPLLVDKSGQKLSKRNADIDLSFFKDTQGVFAATLVNFAALLGWSHTQKSDIFNLEELEQLVRPSTSFTRSLKPTNTSNTVQPQNHPRQHRRGLRKALVPPESARPTLRLHRRARIHRDGDQGIRRSREDLPSRATVHTPTPLPYKHILKQTN